MTATWLSDVVFQALLQEIEISTYKMYSTAIGNAPNLWGLKLEKKGLFFFKRVFHELKRLHTKEKYISISDLELVPCGSTVQPTAWPDAKDPTFAADGREMLCSSAPPPTPNSVIRTFYRICDSSSELKCDLLVLCLFFLLGLTWKTTHYQGCRSLGKFHVVVG